MDASFWSHDSSNKSPNLPEQRYAHNLFTENFSVFPSMPGSTENLNFFHPTFPLMPPSLENRNFLYRAFPKRPRSCAIRHFLQGQDRPKSRKYSKPPTEIPLKIGDSSKSKDSEVKMKVKVKGRRSSRRRQQMSEATAAVKIQKAFRGFAVRRSEPLKILKTTTRLKAITDEIRKRINDREFVDFIRRNEKERVKITDTLISVLLKLDAIQGINTFVLESKEAVVHETRKLREIENVNVGEKPVETKAETSQNDEEFTLPNTVMSPEEIISMHLQAARFNVTCPYTDLGSAEKKIMLCQKQDEYNKCVPMKNPEEKELSNLNENKDSSKASKETCKPVKHSSELVRDYFHDVLKDKQQTRSNMPQANNNEDLFQMDNNHYKNGNTHSIECFKEQAIAGQDSSSKLKRHKIFNTDSDVGAKKGELASNDWELLEKPEDESGGIVEKLREENNKLKVVIEDLYRRDKMQTDIIDNLSKKL